MRHLGRTAFILLALLFATAAVAQQAPNCSIPAPDFSMTISPASQSVPINGNWNANYTLTIYLYNGLPSVSLSIS